MADFVVEFVVTTEPEDRGMVLVPILWPRGFVPRSNSFTNGGASQYFKFTCAFDNADTAIRRLNEAIRESLRENGDIRFTFDSSRIYEVGVARMNIVAP